MADSKKREPLRASDWLRLVIPVLLVAAFVLVAWKLGYFNLKDPKKLDQAADEAQGNPLIAPAFILAYAFVAALAAPISPLAYAAGAMFGVIKGSIYVWIGALLGGIAGYWLARGIWAETAKRLLGRYEDKLSDLKNGNAFLTTLRIQLMPIVPYGVFNYAAGATSLPFIPYVLGTALGIIPGTVAAVYVGEQVASGLHGGGKKAFLIAAVVMGALLLVSFIPNIVSKIRKRSAGQTASH